MKSKVRERTKKMIADMHLHTRLSSDAEQFEGNTPSGYIKNAVERGLKYIAITEHRDIRTGADGLINADIAECEKQVAEEKRKILVAGRSPTKILMGIELAHMHTCPDEATQIISSHKFDFVLGSLHVLRDGFDFCREEFDEFSDEELRRHFSCYLEELYETAATGDFDSFAHCTYPLRYLHRNGRLTDLCESPAENAPEYADIFKKLIEREKALEINTSGIKRGEFTLPTNDLLKLFKKLGGKYVTIGSDSHDVRYVGSGVEQAERMVAEAEFDGVTVYEARQPRIIRF